MKAMHGEAYVKMGSGKVKRNCTEDKGRGCDVLCKVSTNASIIVSS